MSEIDLLSDSIRAVRDDLVQMEDRLTAQINHFRPVCLLHETRLLNLERSSSEGVGRWKTIIAISTFVSAVVSTIAFNVGRWILGR